MDPLRKKLPIPSVLSFVFILLTLSVAVFAQGSQLTLADILIGLRSKKATLPERNQILTDAVLTRGTTFAITPEIEKELSTTGADKALIAAIRMKSQPVKIASVNQPPPCGGGPSIAIGSYFRPSLVVCSAKCFFPSWPP